MILKVSIFVLKRFLDNGERIVFPRVTLASLWEQGMRKVTLPKLISLNIGDINGIHPDVSEIARLADMDHLINPLCLRGACPDEILRHLVLNPIIVSEKSGKCFVVSGFRSYQVALSSLIDQNEIPVLNIGRSSPSERRNWAASAVFLSSLVGSLGKGAAGTVGETWLQLQQIHQSWQENLFLDCKGLRSLARTLKINYNSLFR